MRSAEVVVVGAGVIGASVAYHLAARGCLDVIVLDRGAAPGAGSTSKATGGFRAQFGSEVNVRLSLLSREKLMRFEDEVGADPGYRPSGYLFLAHTAAQLDALRAAQRVQRAAGLHEAREVDRSEIARLNPALALDGLEGGAFCPTDGFLRPMQILEGYCAAAERLGARFLFGEQVVAFRKDGDRIAEVRTGSETFATRHVVNAAGAWAGIAARLAGVDLQVAPARRQVATTGPCDLLPEEMPMTIFVEDGFHLRVRDGRVLLLWPRDHAAADPFDLSFDEEWLDGVASRARERVPCLERAAIDREGCWAGLYEMSPDKHAVVGRSTEVENFYLANGSSGHGVMHAPALGQLVAEITLDGAASSLDVRALRPSRFAEGQPNPASEFL